MGPVGTGDWGLKLGLTIDKLLLEHVGLTFVLDVAVHQVIFRPCDYCVSPSPKNEVLGIFSLGQDFWVRT